MEGLSSRQAKLNYPAAAEAQDGSPVASGLDSTPANWFELGAVLCAQAYIGPDRLWNAIHAVRQAGAL